jgi:3-oxoacyl-[acyl-carrier protein] reductase
MSQSQSLEKVQKLPGKIAIVTGASRGIGRAVAKMFAEEGASVVINYNKSPERAESLRDEIVAMGGDCLICQGDVSKSEDVKKLVSAAMEKYGRVDILVNNVGISFRRRLLESTEEDWDTTIDVNLKSVYLCSKEVAPIMLDQKKGKIVNISSTCGLPAPPVAMEICAYVASKSGVIGLTRALAVNLAPYVNVNVVCPGMTFTDAMDTMSKEGQAIRMSETPLKRFGQPEEIAKAVLYLASSDSDYVTGENLVVAGGRPMM